MAKKRNRGRQLVRVSEAGPEDALTADELTAWGAHMAKLIGAAPKDWGLREDWWLRFVAVLKQDLTLMAQIDKEQGGDGNIKAFMDRMEGIAICIWGRSPDE